MPFGHRRQMAELTSREKKALKPAVASAASAAAQDSAKRRQISVMFSDLLSSTALSARMDPEAARRRVSPPIRSA